MFDTNRALFSNDRINTSEIASGIHHWNVQEDIFYSDSAGAVLFGYSEAEGQRGLPLKAYLDRIHPEDLPRIAKSIHDAMIAGHPYHEEYRVIRPDRTMVEIVVIGTWFRDASGDPTIYSGIMFQKENAATTSWSAQQLCLVALDMARSEGNDDAAQRILEALLCLDSADHRLDQHSTH